MTKKRQRQQHDDMWKVFVQACGGKCCVCGAEAKLQRGHIERHADGGSDDLSNLIPVCKPCNGIYSRTLSTPDARPAEWKANFIRLLIQHLGIGIKWRATSSSGVPHPDSVSVDDARVIPLEEIVFSSEIKYLPTSTQQPQSHSPEAVKAATDQLLRLGRQHSVLIPPPTRKTLDSMHRLAHRFGIQTFLSVGQQFLSLGDWFDENGEIITRLARGHEWERFCENFSLYLGDYRNRLENEAREAEERRKADEELAARLASQRELEKDPEYQRQQEEKRVATVKDNAQRKRNDHVDRLTKNFTSVVARIDLVDDGNPQSRAFYQIRELLRTMRTCSDHELKDHGKTYIRLMDVLENPPKQDTDTGEEEL